MIPFRADLHCHSTCSDGSLTPSELIELAAKSGLKGLSITDHDSVGAYTPEIFKEAEEAGIKLIPGVEFSTGIDSTSIHLLGYDVSLESPELISLCNEHVIRRRNRCRAILKRLEQSGMPVSETELLETVAAVNPKDRNNIVGRPHIAQMMVKLGYVQTVTEAFKKYIGEDGPCYVQGEYISPAETIETIHKAGGIAVIAHPHLIKKPNILKRLLEMKFDGIECYYSKFPKEDHLRWIKIANYRGMLITGGSDFHGTIKPSITLGCSWIDEEHFNKLMKHDIYRASGPSL